MNFLANFFASSSFYPLWRTFAQTCKSRQTLNQNTRGKYEEDNNPNFHNYSTWHFA
jgi:hypothetical protein